MGESFNQFCFAVKNKESINGIAVGPQFRALNSLFACVRLKEFHSRVHLSIWNGTFQIIRLLNAISCWFLRNWRTEYPCVPFNRAALFSTRERCLVVSPMCCIPICRAFCAALSTLSMASKPFISDVRAWSWAHKSIQTKETKSRTRTPYEAAHTHVHPIFVYNIVCSVHVCGVTVCIVLRAQNCFASLVDDQWRLFILSSLKYQAKPSKHLLFFIITYYYNSFLLIVRTQKKSISLLANSEVGSQFAHQWSKFQTKRLFTLCLNVPYVAYIWIPHLTMEMGCGFPEASFRHKMGSHDCDASTAYLNVFLNVDNVLGMKWKMYYALPVAYGP